MADSARCRRFTISSCSRMVPFRQPTSTVMPNMKALTTAARRGFRLMRRPAQVLELHGAGHGPKDGSVEAEGTCSSGVLTPGVVVRDADDQVGDAVPVDVARRGDRLAQVVV